MSGGDSPRARELRPSDPRELGAYRILGRLGEGGMGRVYLAEAPDGTPVALKVIRAELADDAEFRRRFRSEVTRARQVPPFCTAEVLDADTEHEPPYLVVEYVDGPSLSAVVEERGPLTPANQHGLAVGVAVALTAIHGAGVIHRDLKPSNVLLAPGSPKVIDFGIARAADATNANTQTGQVLGTVAYMSPERFGPDGSHAITPAADTFAWGAVVAYAGTGRTPFRADVPAALAVRIMTAEPDLHGLRGPLRDLVESALAKNPADRPTARQLVDQLLAGSGAPARPAAFAEQPEVLAAAGISPRSTVELVATPSQTTEVRTLPVDHTVPTAHLEPGQIPPVQVLPRQVPPGQVPPVQFPPRQSPPVVPDPPPGPGRRGSRITLAALTVSVLLLAGTVAGIVSGALPLPRTAGTSETLTPTRPPGPTLSPTAGPSASPSSSPSAGPSARPTPSVAAGARLALRDPLTVPKDWQPRAEPARKATCAFDNAFVVTSGITGSYRCRGNQTSWRDFSVFVDVTLINEGSCAGMWFRFASERGYALRICADGYYFVTHGTPLASTVATLRDFRFGDATIATGDPTRVGITAEGGSFRFYRDGEFVGGWNDSTFTAGRVVPGIFQVADTAQPPFQVSFANIEIWSPDG